MRHTRLFWILAGASIALSGTPARAAGFDRDSLLTEAPATPEGGTVRVSGGGSGEHTDGSGQAVLSGSVMWAVGEHVAADVGFYFQNVGSTAGPTARVRYQFLSQSDSGFDLGGGLRYKSVGFDPNRSEAELLLAAGRSFGRVELALNTVFGVEFGGGGKDLEVKGFGGYRVLDEVRLGVDSRLQLEVGDEEAAPVSSVPRGDDYDLTVGPAASWMVTRTLQVQALVGVAHPKGALKMGPTGQLFVSMDF